MSNCRRRDQITNFWKKTQDHLVIIREWPKSTLPVLRNLDNFPPGAVYPTLLQLGTKDYVKTIIVFLHKFYFFCRRHSLMNWPCYNNLFKIVQHGIFRDLNRVIFTQWKLLKSQVDTFRYCLTVLKRHTFPCLLESAPIPGNQSSWNNAVASSEIVLQRCYVKKDVLRNFVNFTGKYLCHRLWQRYFPVNFAANCRRIVWMCSTILWDWRLKG